jgi:predicted nuclease of restriction endonuclease-like (RecB) superfamily
VTRHNKQQQCNARSDTKQGASKGKAKSKRKAKEEETKHNEKLKKHKVNKEKSVLDFISLSFCGLPWWSCRP